MHNKYDLIVSIVNYNGEDYISKCLDLLLKACRSSSIKILVVCIDNNSFDSSKDIINNYQGIEKIFLTENIGYSSAHNYILRNWEAKYFLLLNPDTLIQDEYNLDIMFNYMDDHPEIAIATCTILDENYNVMPSVAHQPTLINGFVEQFKFKPSIRISQINNKLINKLSTIFPVILSNFNSDNKNPENPLNVNFVYGAYLFLRKSALDIIGYFDENFFLFWEEIDLCIRAKESKFLIGFNPQTFIIHKYQKSQFKVQELSYYWRVASYFWIFKKYYPYKLIVWSLFTSLFQTLFFTFKIVKSQKKWLKVHSLLFELSVSFGNKYQVLINQVKYLYPKL